MGQKYFHVIFRGLFQGLSQLIPPQIGIVDPHQPDMAWPQNELERFVVQDLDA